MEFKFFALTVDAYMERMGVDLEEVIQKFGKGTKVIIEGHLTDTQTGEQHKTWARHTGPKTYTTIMEELVQYMQAFAQ